MREPQVRRRSSAGPGQCRSALALLYLVLTAAQMEGASIVGYEAKFPSGTNAKNGRLTITATQLAPGIEPRGNLKLTTDNSTSERGLPGEYQVNDGVLTANFNIERGWNEVIYKFISGGPFKMDTNLRTPIRIPPISQKSLVIAVDPKLTRDDTASFLATSADAPSSEGATICDPGLYLFQSRDSALVKQQVRSIQGPSFTGKGLGLTFQLDRYSSEQPNLDVVLELCRGSDRLVYRGRLPRAAVFYELKAGAQENASSPRSLALSFTGPPVNRAESLNAKIIEGIAGISSLNEGKTITFTPRGDSYQSEIPYSCSSGEVDFPKLLLVAHDDKEQYVLRSSGGTLCPGRSLWDYIKMLWQELRKTSIVWWILGALLLPAVGLIIWRKRSIFPVSRAENSPPETLNAPSSPLPEEGNPPFTGLPKVSFPNGWKTSLAETLHSQLEPLYSTIRDINSALRQLLNQQIQLLAATDKLSPVDSSPEVVKLGEFNSPSQPIGSGQEISITNLINLWWADGADRDRLSGLIQQDSSIKSYRPSNLQDSLRSSTNRTFQFQPSGGPIEWLGRMQQGDLFLVPGDPRLFQTGDSLKFLGVLFDGLGSSLSNVRFRRVVKACRLRKEPGSSDRYRIADRGALELEGRTPAEAPTLPAQPVLPRQDLAETIQRAVEEVMPSGLPAQIQDLTRQVRLLTENGSRQVTQSPSPDTNLTAALNAVRQEVSALGQRMNAIEAMALAVASLDGSLERIEGELRNLSAQPPLLASPVASPAALPPKSGGKKKLRTEDRLEEMIKGVREGIPAVALPIDPQPLAPPTAPEELWAKLQRWWPQFLNNGIPDGNITGEPSADYLRSLETSRKSLAGSAGDRGWQIDVVHVKVPDNPSAGAPILQIHEPYSIEGQCVVCTCVPNTPFSGPLLFQFALRVRGDNEHDIAVLPALGLRLTGSIEGYARLAGGELPENATSLAEVTRPAILSWAGSEDFFTVALPIQAKFR
jgi:hypothetical protein